jgi:hypothetical protein
MRVFLALLILISPGLLKAADDPSMPAADQRAIRELQDKAYGSPTLPTDASGGESLLALAALGSTASQPGDQNLQADDYAALLALLQRYRDDLLKMGMDSSELQAQLTVLEARTKELEARLDALQPRDGLKIYGRFYSLFDDLQVLGPGYIPPTPAEPGLTPGSVGKPAASGVRTQLGEVHTELKLQGTRGPVSAYAQMDLVLPWGENVAQIGLRRVTLEMRLPVVIEAGDLDASLTPLTLWRDDQYQPFEPSLFSERRDRMEGDLLLKPDDWTVTGVRASTDALIFNSVTLHLQSLSAIAGYASGAGLASLSQQIIYLESPLEGGAFLAERYNTYMEGWEASVPMLENRLNLGYYGLVFFDVSSTAPTPVGQGYVPMNETVQSLRASYKDDSFDVNAEGATSSYQEPWQADSPEAVEGPLTGTALTADGAWKGDNGYLKLFGRYVSSGFHASGAQGRTVDYDYQFLGPFMTEDSQVGANGQLGLEGSLLGVANGGIPLSNASRLNDQLIPPGVYEYNQAAPGGVWQNLLPYGPGEEIDPYGVASPNRAGAGVEATYKWFNGALQPLASAEAFQELDPVTDTVGTTLNAFSMTRYRGGLMLDLAPLFNFPLRLGGGVTMTDSQNGQTGANGVANNMSTQTMDASVQWNAGKPVGIQAGYRQMVAQGQDETFVYGPGGETWNILGVGVWWRPASDISVDVLTTQGHTIVADDSYPTSTTSHTLESGNLEWSETVARVTMEF